MENFPSPLAGISQIFALSWPGWLGGEEKQTSIEPCQELYFSAKSGVYLREWPKKTKQKSNMRIIIIMNSIKNIMLKETEN